jgi:hypothetical protein
VISVEIILVVARKEVQKTFFGVCLQSALGFFVDNDLQRIFSGAACFSR